MDKQFLSISTKSELRAWLKKNPKNEELEEFINNCSPSNNLWQIAKFELEKRILQKPHWTLIPTFWLVLIGSFAGVICAFLAIQSYLEENGYSFASEGVPKVESPAQTPEPKPK
jgi:hypothetical protein